MTDIEIFFDVPIKNNKEETCKKIIEMIRNNDNTTGHLLSYEYFLNHYKQIAIYLSNRTEIENTDRKQQINFIGGYERNEGATIENAEEKIFNFS